MTSTATHTHHLAVRAVGATIVVALAAALATLPTATAHAASNPSTGTAATTPKPSLVAKAMSTGQPGTGLALPKVMPTKAMPTLNRAKVATLPASVDLRSYAMPIGNQGTGHQSCVGWAIGYALMGMEAKLRGINPPTFAPYYVFSQINGGVDQPTNPADAMNILYTKGDDWVPDYVQEMNMLVAGGRDDPITPPTAAEHANAAAWKISGYTAQVTPGYLAGTTGATNIKTVLASGHPVAIGMRLRQGFYNMNNTGISYDSDISTAVNGGHEILAVGYNANGLIIQNSWGLGFGASGYATLAWNVVQNDVTSAYSMSGFASSHTTTTDKTAPAVGAATSVPLLGGQSSGAGDTYYTTSFTASDASGIAATQVDVSVDGGSWTQLNLPSAAATSFNYLLSPGHSYQFITAAQDKAGNWSAWTYGTKFSVAGFSEAYASYSTGWTQASWTSAVGGALKYSGTTNASASFTFTGKSVAWVATKDPARGVANVYLDGVYKGTVNLYSATTAARSVVLWYSWAASGTHTLQLTVAGTTGHPDIDIDNYMLTG